MCTGPWRMECWEWHDSYHLNNLIELILSLVSVRTPLNFTHTKSVVVYVCFITKSFLTYSFFSPTPALSTISRPLSSSMCSITPETANVCSSYNRMRGPGIGCWFSDRSNCSHWSFEAAVLPINPNIYTDQWKPLVIYHSITFTFTGPYTTMQPTLLTSWLQLLSYVHVSGLRIDHLCNMTMIISIAFDI